MNCWAIRLPIMLWFGPPRNCAVAKSPSAGKNVSSAPPTTPAAVAGRVTCKNVCRGLP